MLTHEEAVRLNQTLAGTKVLSVYLRTGETDPAERRAWRIRLNGMLKALEEGLAEAPEAERRAARASIERIERELEGFGGRLPERGWAGFATADAVHHAGPTPAPVPDLVRWEAGAHVAPYVRVLKQSRPVSAVVADQRRARLLTYRHGELREDEVLWSDYALAEGVPDGASKRASTHSGMRGEARSDAARRGVEDSARRLLREAGEALEARAREGHLLVVGGSAETARALLASLPERTRARTIEAPGLRAEASLAELKEVVEDAASALSERLQRALVEEVLDLTRADGRACLGPERTGRALEAGAVDTLVLSRAFARAEPDLAERFVDRALAQGAAVEEISEAVAAELDREGGIGARLRFAA